MSVVGAAVILGVIIVAMLRMRVARASVVVVCVLFGLVLGASPVGDAVNTAVAAVGGWAAARLGRAVMGLSTGRDDPAVFLRPQVVRVSLWAVFGLWLARRLTRLLLLIVRSPAALAAILLTAAFVAGWRLVHPALPLGICGGLVAGLAGGGSAGPPRTTAWPQCGCGRGGAGRWCTGAAGPSRWTRPG